jgi:porin
MVYMKKYILILVCVLAGIKVINSQTISSEEETLNPGNTASSSSNEHHNEESHGFFQRETITGNWWGLRNDLSSAGLDFTFCYKGELFSNLSGGIEKNSALLDNYDLFFNFDLDKMINLSNTKLFVYILGNNGTSVNDLAGSSQGISNIETVPTWKIYQFLIQKSFFDEHLLVLFGLYDFNSDFDVKESSGIFINPSHGIGPDISSSGLNGPSIFPTTSLAFRTRLAFENFYIQAAAFDGVPGDPENPCGTKILLNKEDGLLLAGEIGLIKSLKEQLDFKIALGCWGYTSEFANNNYLLQPESNLDSQQYNYGLYMNGEKCLYNSEYSDSNLLGFFRIGYANKNVNPVDYYIGGGIKLGGLFDDVENEIAFAIAYCHNSALYRQIFLLNEELEIKPHEINIEATISIKLTRWLAFQPDVQYVINPAHSTSQNSFLIGTRLVLDF